MAHPIRKTLAQQPILRFLASIKITITCLSLLLILTFGGTIAQVNQGLYLAQERFFNSWGFLAGGFIPFPGAQLVLWILFINLCAVSLIRFVYRWSHLGIMIIHGGLLLYFVSAFLTFNAVVESNISLREGEQTNVSNAYHKWELSFWKAADKDVKNITALDADDLKTNAIISIPPLKTAIDVSTYYRNAQAFTAAPDGKTEEPHINASAIRYLAQAKVDTAPEKNFPGIIFTLRDHEKPQNVLLFGGENNPTKIIINGEDYFAQLRRKRYELPLLITLNDFQKEFHPGTEVARAFRSFVTIKHENLERNEELFMNNPLRFKDYTFYQAAYSIDQMGRESSTLAVVKNYAQPMPYVASLVTFLGLMTHFLTMAFKRR